MEHGRRRQHALVLSVIVLFALAHVLVAAPASAAAIGSWTTVPTPTPGKGEALQGIANVSRDDAWAVGSYEPSISSSATQPLTEHWDGQSWTAYSNPSIGISAYLYGASGAATNDVWAVGVDTLATYASQQALIEHWNGTWTQFSGPLPGAASSLSAVVSLGAADAWAVGWYQPSVSSGGLTLIEHWDGARWSVVPSPNPVTSGTNVSNALQGISGVAADDIWAVGSYHDPTSGQILPLMEHWNGTAWSIVSGPPSSLGDQLVAVAAVSTTDVWAVGGYINSTVTQINPIIMHWDGTSWSLVPHPESNATGYLYGVSGVNSSDVWAVGYTSPNGGSSGQPLIEQWDGTSWNNVPAASTPNAGQLDGVSASSSGNMWAVGEGNGPSGQGTLAERYTPAQVPITAGWNLIDVPLQGTGITTMSALTERIDDPTQLGPGAVSAASTYAHGRFMVYVPGFSADQPLQSPQGIFVLSAVSGTWTPAGDFFPTGQTVNLVPGWNLVEAPFPATGLTASSVASEAQGCGVQEIALYSGGSYQTWSNGGSDFPIPSTSGFWLLCKTTSTWTPS